MARVQATKAQYASMDALLIPSAAIVANDE